MHVGRNHDAEPRACVDIDVRVDAPLRDQTQLREPLEQRPSDRRSLANEHERFRLTETSSERVDVLGVVVPDRDIVCRELREAGERPYRVEVVVEDRDLHRSGHYLRDMTFYEVCAGAAATLVGLLFVAVQIGPPLRTPGTISPRHAIARSTFSVFATIVIVSLLYIVPD